MKKFLIYIFISIFIFSGCSSTNSTDLASEVETNSADLIDNEEDSLDQTNQDEILDSEEMQSLKVDESQEIMVLMYHNIGTEEATWTRTPENFRRDLETLYNSRFRTISLEDYVQGNISTQKGFTPVVITFDDGNENNFRYLDNGKIDPLCAVGIFETFKKDFPDFNTTATFFLNSLAFGNSEQEQEKLKFLSENDYSVGNHTFNHLDLKKASPDDIQKDIARLKSKHETTYPDLNIQTLALPYGAKPSEENYHFTYNGSFEGITYNNIAVLLVGWDPYLSPYHVDFDFSKIRRVRASETNVDDVGIYNWLSSYDEGNKKRFISDGNPNTISVPLDREESISETKFEDKKIISY